MAGIFACNACVHACVCVEGADIVLVSLQLDGLLTAVYDYQILYQVCLIMNCAYHNCICHVGDYETWSMPITELIAE